MTPRERVQAVLDRRIPDRVPRFEIWIDALLPELGQSDPVAAYVNLGQDCVMLPSRRLPGSPAWGTGVDELGRVWQDGMYVTGAVSTPQDLARYTPDPAVASHLFDAGLARRVRRRFPDHCLIFGTHVGPFTAAYMAMGLEHFFLRLADQPAFVHSLLEARTDWCIAVYRRAVELGAEVVVLGDDAATGHGPMISPAMWRQYVLPCHQRIVAALGVPVLWHSDGDIRPLIPMAIEAGFCGLHSLEPGAGIDLAQVKAAFGDKLVLVGNIDVQVLCQDNLSAVRAEVDRCLQQGAPNGGYMLATCNSIFAGMNAAAVAEMFSYSANLGVY